MFVEAVWRAMTQLLSTQKQNFGDNRDNLCSQSLDTQLFGAVHGGALAGLDIDTDAFTRLPWVGGPGVMEAIGSPEPLSSNSLRVQLKKAIEALQQRATDLDDAR